LQAQRQTRLPSTAIMQPRMQKMRVSSSTAALQALTGCSKY
jgi:hypothetical protein